MTPEEKRIGPAAEWGGCNNLQVAIPDRLLLIPSARLRASLPYQLLLSPGSCREAVLSVREARFLLLVFSHVDDIRCYRPATGKRDSRHGDLYLVNSGSQ